MKLKSAFYLVGGLFLILASISFITKLDLLAWMCVAFGLVAVVVGKWGDE